MITDPNSILHTCPLYSDKSKNHFTSDNVSWKDILKQRLFFNHTLPFAWYLAWFSLPDSLIEQDVKLCESYALAVLNECTRHGVKKDEAIR